MYDNQQRESSRGGWIIDDSDPLELGFSQTQPPPSPSTPAGPVTRSSHGIQQSTRIYVPGVSVV